MEDVNNQIADLIIIVDTIQKLLLKQNNEIEILKKEIEILKLKNN
jgi:archaellum component FlaC